MRFPILTLCVALLAGCSDSLDRARISIDEVGTFHQVLHHQGAVVSAGHVYDTFVGPEATYVFMAKGTDYRCGGDDVGPQMILSRDVTIYAATPERIVAMSAAEVDEQRASDPGFAKVLVEALADRDDLAKRLGTLYAVAPGCVPSRP
jgi:hypothetical protein